MNNDTNTLQTPVSPSQTVSSTAGFGAKKSHPLITTFIGIIIGTILVGGFTYWQAQTKIDVINNDLNANPTVSTSTANTIGSTGATLITPKNIPISFEIPEGYAAFQEEGFEGGYYSEIRIGKLVSKDSYSEAPLQITFRSYIHNEKTNRSQTLSEYLESVAKTGFNSKNIELFGNKAVEYIVDVDTSTAISGYLTREQITGTPAENSNESDFKGLFVQITTSTYGSGIADDKNLFDKVMSTIKVVSPK